MTKRLSFSLRVSTELSEYHGLEVCIGELTIEELKDIKKCIEDKSYFDSDFFLSYYNYNLIYHNSGILLYECDFFEHEFDDPVKRSSKLFSGIDFTNIGEETQSLIKVEHNELVVPKKGTFLISFRNESIYFNAEGEVDDEWVGPLSLQIADLPVIDCGILHSVNAENKEWERLSENEEGSGEIFGIHQFLLVNGNVVFYASEGIEYPFNNYVQSYTSLSPAYSNKELIISNLKSIDI